MTAPFAGYVAKVEVAEGDQVNTGQTLVSLYPAAGLEVRAKIAAPNQEETLAQLGERADLIALADIGGEPLRFRLTRVAGAADARGLDAFFQARAGNASLRVGSLVSLQLLRAPVAAGIAVPYTALYGGRRVYRVVDGRLQAVEVEVHGELPGKTPRLLVTSPVLKAGDRLAATHLPNAASGLKVQSAQP